MKTEIKQTQKMSASRLHTLGIIRGLAVINMIIYHACWDMVYIFDFQWQWYKGDIAHVWQQCICMTFILLSGFCCFLGKRTLKRGAIVFAAGAVITAVTLAVMPGNRVVFGILTLLGSCMLILAPLKKYLCRIPPMVGVAVSLLLFIFLRRITDGYIGIFSLRFHLPKPLYNGYLSAYFGFPAESFFSTDYFPLLPWIFLFFAGVFLFLLCRPKMQNIKALKINIPALCFIGRHSLVIYMLHQPVIYGALYLTLEAFG